MKKVPYCLTIGPGPADARGVVVLALAIIFAYEIWAILTTSWTISHEWWTWKDRYPWLTVVLGVVLFFLWGHLSFEWGRITRSR